MSRTPPYASGRADAPGARVVEDTAGGMVWYPTGAWVLDRLPPADDPFGGPRPPARPPRVTIDLSRLTALDTAGALTLARAVRAAGTPAVTLTGGRDAHRELLDAVLAWTARERPPRPRSPGNRLLVPLARLGGAVLEAFAELGRQIAFVVRLAGAVGRLGRRPDRWPLVPLVAHVERAGVEAAPLVGLLSLMIGGVLAFLGADMLARFGASIFTVNLVSFGFLREFGVLLAAILVAGRSASAFAAEIGSMKAREEIDAMRVIGLDPLARLIVPRIAALVIALPLLVVVADLLGLLGGAIVSAVVLDVSPELFVTRLRETTELRHAVAGLVKAPFFALLIGTIGCHQGLQVEGDTASVGRRTTRAVVQAIFAVILADAFFAVVLLELGL